MKFFNWVQRNVLKEGLARNIKKTDSIAIDTNSKALLEQVALFDVLDGWRYGILKIGTFGFDPLKSFGEQDDHLPLGSDDEEKEERCSNDNDDKDDVYDDKNSDEEVNPLMFSTFDHCFEDVASNVDNAKCGKSHVDGVAEGSTDHEIKFGLDAIEGHSGKLRRRATLADLFNEDSDMKKKTNPLDLESNPSKTASFRTKKGLSFAKKFIPEVGKDSSPIKMLHQMRRMLKRKIHPDLEGKGNKLEGQCKP